jgi:hypothetical protein
MTYKTIDELCELYVGKLDLGDEEIENADTYTE